MTTLDGEVAVVTGAAGGMGGAIAAALLKAGARLALVDLDAARLDTVASDIGGGEDVATFAADLSDDAQAAAVPDRVRQHFGSVDLLVNNAGVRQIAPMLELSAEDWRHTLDVDLTAPFVLSKAAIPGMIEKGRGKIVNIASMAGELAFAAGRPTASPRPG